MGTLIKNNLNILVAGFGCCKQEIYAASGPLYDIARLGVNFVSIPEDADVLVIQGFYNSLGEERLLDYTAVPNLKELGFEILAMTFGNRAAFPSHAELQIQKAKDFIERHPNTVFVSSGRGLNSDRVVVSVHKDYSEYSNFHQEIKQEWGEIMEVVGSFLISLPNDSVLRHLTFKYLAELMKRENVQKKP